MSDLSAPFLRDPDVTLYHGDALETLRRLAADRLSQLSLLTEANA